MAEKMCCIFIVYVCLFLYLCGYIEVLCIYVKLCRKCGNNFPRKENKISIYLSNGIKYSDRVFVKSWIVLQEALDVLFTFGLKKI